MPSASLGEASSLLLHVACRIPDMVRRHHVLLHQLHVWGADGACPAGQKVRAYELDRRARRGRVRAVVTSTSS